MLNGTEMAKCLGKPSVQDKEDKHMKLHSARKAEEKSCSAVPGTLEKKLELDLVENIKLLRLTADVHSHPSHQDSLRF